MKKLNLNILACHAAYVRGRGRGVKCPVLVIWFKIDCVCNFVDSDFVSIYLSLHVHLYVTS